MQRNSPAQRRQGSTEPALSAHPAAKIEMCCAASQTTHSPPHNTVFDRPIWHSYIALPGTAIPVRRNPRRKTSSATSNAGGNPGCRLASAPQLMPVSPRAWSPSASPMLGRATAIPRRRYRHQVVNTAKTLQNLRDLLQTWSPACALWFHLI